MNKKTFLEVMAGSDHLNLSNSQKRVLFFAFNSAAVDDPELNPETVSTNAEKAADEIIGTRDSRNLLAAAKILARQGYLKTEPDILGPHDEPNRISLTQKGMEAVETNNITDEVLTPEEKEKITPSDQTADGIDSGLPAGEDLEGEEPLDDELGGEEPKKAKGGGMELELSSFFKEIDQNRKFIKN